MRYRTVALRQRFRLKSSIGMLSRGILSRSMPLPTVAHRFLWTLPVVVVLGLLGTALEGVGIGLLMPLLHILHQSEPATAQGGLVATLTQLGADLSPETRLIVISGAIVGLILLKNAVLYANRVFVSWVYGKASHELRCALAERLLDVGYGFFPTVQPGRLVHILATESWRASEAVQTAFNIVTNLCAIIILLGFLVLLSWEMTLVVALGLVIVQGAQTLSSTKLKPLSRIVTDESGTLTARMLEIIQATRLIRLFGQEAYEAQRFSTASESVRRAILGLEIRKWFIQPTGEVLYTLLLLTVLLAAWHSGIEFPAFAAFIILLYRLQPPIRAAQTAVAQLRSWAGSIEEVEWLLEPAGKPGKPQGSIPFAGFRKDIVFEGVRFHYGSDVSGPVGLADVNFRIMQGRSVAIIGASGSGKTTIVNLLCRFVDPSAGVIRIDGIPLSQIDVAQWRRCLALASQDLDLIDGTIAENIRYGAGEAPFEEIVEAARVADAHDFISRLPDGYETLIGSRGVNFSAGQRQRIALCRALVRKPEILILDEATNAIDGLSEASIFAALQARRAKSTTIVISHRKSTISNCDDGVIVRQGRVVDHGPLPSLHLQDVDIF